MKIFLAYASSDKDVAEDVNAVLSAAGHDVFFDREDLPAGVAHARRLKQEVQACELLVILVSPDSFSEGRYTLNELDYWREISPNPDGKLLPVFVRPTLQSSLTPYVRAVSPLYPQGHIATAVLHAIDRVQREQAAKDQGEPAGPALRLPAAGGFADQRLAAYRALWEITQTLPRWPRPADVQYAALSELSTSLRTWYFVGGNGILLSRAAHTRYAAIQNTLEAILLGRPGGLVSAAHYEEVRQVCSALRTQLAADVGART